MDEKKPFHNPFSSLSSLRDRLPDNRSPGSEDVRSPGPSGPGMSPGTKPGKTYARAVVRMERSGRGGKEVTVIEHLDLPPTERDTWLKALKASLGCGGVVEGASLILQGDHRKRLPAILTARGVKRVTVG